MGLGLGCRLCIGRRGGFSGLKGPYLLDVDNLILYDKDGYYLIPVV